MLNHLKRTERGDTIVEVLLATVVISIVIAGAYTLTNRATRINQTALERTTATNLVRQQIEFIRGMQTYGRSDAAWSEIENNYAVNAVPSYSNCQPSGGSRPFGLDMNRGYDDAATVVDYDFGSDTNLFKTWVEAHQPSADYVDFHVRVCWEGIGQTGDLGIQRAVSMLRLSL
jgi:Tfp pilus assembly protein PilV